MATIREIYNVLFDFAPADMKLDWDNVGLACGHFDAEVHKILVALDPMPDVFEEAKAQLRAGRDAPSAAVSGRQAGKQRHLRRKLPSVSD